MYGVCVTNKDFLILYYAVRVCLPPFLLSFVERVCVLPLMCRHWREGGAEGRIAIRLPFVLFLYELISALQYRLVDVRFFFWA